MWILRWKHGIESFAIAEDARFAYWLLRINGFAAGISYERTYI